MAYQRFDLIFFFFFGKGKGILYSHTEKKLCTVELPSHISELWCLLGKLTSKMCKLKKQFGSLAGAIGTLPPVTFTSGPAGNFPASLADTQRELPSESL